MDGSITVDITHGTEEPMNGPHTHPLELQQQQHVHVWFCLLVLVISCICNLSIILAKDFHIGAALTELFYLL